jgi:hypothetical protein
MGQISYRLWFKTHDQRTHVWRGVRLIDLDKALNRMQKLYPNWLFWRLYAHGGEYIQCGQNPVYKKRRSSSNF